MQQNYFHCVLPKKTLDEDKNNDAQEARVAVIFRDGNFKSLDRDTGKPISDLRPPPPIKPKPFGNCIGLVKGQLYTRNSMMRNGFHMYVMI